MLAQPGYSLEIVHLLIFDFLRPTTASVNNIRLCRISGLLLLQAVLILEPPGLDSHSEAVIQGQMLIGMVFCCGVAPGVFLFWLVRTIQGAGLGSSGLEQGRSIMNPVRLCTRILGRSMKDPLRREHSVSCPP